MIDRFERFTLAINEISRYWHKLAAEEMDKYGLKANHASYLIAMLRHPEGITAPKLCEECGKDKADVSRMMNIMEKKGLVVKQGSNQNLYRGSFVLTKEGKTAALHVSSRARAAVEFAGKDLTEQNRLIFYCSLELIVNNLRILNETGIPIEENVQQENL